MTWQEDAEAADDWQAKNNPAWERNLRRAAVATALSEAVRMPEADGLAWLKDPKIAHQLERLIAISPPAEDETTNRNALDLALVIGRRDLVDPLRTGALSSDNGLLMQYRVALNALLDRRPYRVPSKVNAKGWLATFVPHLKLAEALSTKGDVQKAVTEVDEAFAKRNRTKSMVDPECIDGDGSLPVKWDLRKQALFAASRG